MGTLYYGDNLDILKRTIAMMPLRSDKLGSVMRAFMEFLGTNDMMAYLAMMAPRLVELRRALKPTGSLYLHCDPTASHNPTCRPSCS